MSSNPSRTSPISLLRADGRLEPLPLKPPPFQPGFVVLAREKCLFERFDAPPSLKGRAAAAAARLHAGSAAPYQRNGVLITHKGSSFGIWWWDAQWVGEKLGGAGVDPAIRVLPEPLVRAAGEGWRIARASTGYEAQLWKGGFLHADLWRRGAFDDAAWRDFARVQGGDAAGADSAVLIAQEAPWTLNSAYRRTVLSDWTPQKTVQTAIAAGIVAIVCASLYLVGEKIGLDRDTAATQAEAAALQDLAVASAGARADAGAVAALRSKLQGADPLVMLEDAQALIAPFGHTLIAFETNRQEVTLVLSGEAAEDVDVLTRELASSPYFENVSPRLNEDRDRLTIVMTAKGAPPAQTAARPRRL